MWRSISIVVAGIGIELLWACSPAVSASLQRIPLQLDGSTCTAQHAQIAAILSATPGVRAVDFTMVSDHVLVDVDSAMLSGQDLLQTVQGALMADGNCSLTVMQSCITADSHAPRQNSLRHH